SCAVTLPGLSPAATFLSPRSAHPEEPHGRGVLTVNRPFRRPKPHPTGRALRASLATPSTRRGPAAVDRVSPARRPTLSSRLRLLAAPDRHRGPHQGRPAGAPGATVLPAPAFADNRRLSGQRPQGPVGPLGVSAPLATWCPGRTG